MSETTHQTSAEPVGGDDGPSEADVIKAVLGASDDEEREIRPPLQPGEEYDFDAADEDDSGWVGPSPEEWARTRATVQALAQAFEQRDAGSHFSALDDPSFTLDPLDETFETNLAELLAARDAALVQAVAQQLQPFLASVRPLVEERNERVLAEGQQKLAELLESEARGLDRELVLDLARASVLEALDAGEHVDDAAAEQAIREAAARLRGARSGGRSSRRSSIPKPPPGGDETEVAAVQRIFRSEQGSIKPGE